ncbi:MAG: hypothetical protein ACPG47_11075, partial [Leucothrix sp.]
KSTLLLGKRGTETAVSISPRALTTVKTGNNLRVNLPVSLHEKTLDYYGIPPHPSDLFGWSQDALYRLNIDINNGTMSMLAPLVAEANNLPENADFAIDTQWQQDRSAIIDGHDYYLKRDQIFTASH